MSCAACVDKVQRGVGRLPGVSQVRVDLDSGVVDVRWTRDFAGLERVRQAIEDVGYDTGGTDGGRPLGEPPRSGAP
jgi:copper ion binding protein